MNPKRHISKVFSALLSLPILLATIAVPVSSRADHKSQGWINIDQLSGYVQGDHVYVDYQVQLASWNWVLGERIQPVMTVQFPDGQRVAAWMTTRQGRLEFSIPRGCRVSQIDISFSGTGTWYQIDWLNLNGTPMWSARVQTPEFDRRRDRGQPGQGHGDRGRGRGRGNGGHQQQTYNWVAVPAVIQACGDAFEGAANEGECLRAMPAFRFDPTATIRACEDAMEGDVNELACVKTLSAAAFDQSAGVTACEVAMEGDVNELACVAVLARVTFDLTPTIRACEESMEGDNAELNCISLAAGGSHF